MFHLALANTKIVDIKNCCLCNRVIVYITILKFLQMAPGDFKNERNEHKTTYVTLRIPLYGNDTLELEANKIITTQTATYIKNPKRCY